MLVIVWQYDVKPGRTEDFEAFYRPDGPWGSFFHGAPGFVSVTLMRSLHQPGRYLVSDRWTSEALYERFKASREADHRELTARGQRLIEREVEVGRFEFID